LDRHRESRRHPQAKGGFRESNFGTELLWVFEMPATSHPWSILEHAAWDGPGLIACEAQAQGLRTDVRRLDLSAGVPEPDEIEAWS
jgi:hypothetical protein